MSTDTQIDQRLKAVEKAISELQQRIPAADKKKNNWITRITGSFKDDSVFEEILKYGREIRDADRPNDEGVA